MRLEGLIGQHLGRYQIEALIGRGGMAAVYRAFDPALQRNVALKVLYPQFLADPSLIERFRREAITAASLDHPYIAPIYDVGDADGLVYLAMKLLPGPSLAELLQREGRMPLSSAAVLVAEVAAALDEAHAHGIVHRDIKPGNVLFDARGRAMLTDFGIAKSLESSSLTETSVIVGTPDYIAPEQIDPRLAPGGQIDGRADIYALGAMLYRAITGRRPFEGSAQNVLLSHLQQEPPSPSTIVPGIPPGVDAVIGQALRKHPEDRYFTAGEFARDFAAATSDVTEIGMVVPAIAQRHDINTRTTTEVVPVLVQVVPSRRRSTIRLAIGVLASIVVLASVVLYTYWPTLGSTPSAGVGNDVLAAGTPATVTTTLASTTPTVQEDVTAIVTETITATTTATMTATTTETITATTTATTTFVPTETVAASLTAAPPAPPAPTRPSATVPPLPVPAQPSATVRPLPVPAQPSATVRPLPTSTRALPTSTRTVQQTPSVEARPATLTPTTPPAAVTEEPATVTPLPTSTNTAAPPPPTEAPAPTSTEPPQPTIAPEPPTDTPAFAVCDAPLDGGFGTLWRGEQGLQERLGCPIRGETVGAAAEQVFENGTMYWWSGNQQIYILTAGVGWSQYPNTYSEGLTTVQNMCTNHATRRRA